MGTNGHSPEFATLSEFLEHVDSVAQAAIRQEHGGASYVTRAGTYTVALGDFDYRVTLAKGRPGEAIASVRELTVIARDDGPGVTVRKLAGARLGEVIRAAVREATVHGVREGALSPRLLVEPTDTVIARAARAPGRRPGRPRSPSADLPLVKQLYEDAQQRSEPTTAAVAQGLSKATRTHVSRDMARKRVAEARRAGLLPPAISTRPNLYPNNSPMTGAASGTLGPTACR